MAWKLARWTIAILAIVFLGFLIYRGLQIQGNR
jgi:hypothetical protein